MKKKLIVLLATGTYLGFSPIVSGTVGTLWGVLIAFLERGASASFHGTVLVIITLVSIYVSGKAIVIFGKKDPSEVVCDEVAGYLAAFFLIPFTLFNAILIFFLFRIFDIVKPYPASFIDREMRGGAGIVLDDIVAGIYANIAAQIILFIFR